ncbi:MAG TPA: hypothetical protein VLC28_11005, partial [Flavitalea sp.]|nr:hypothetical protein [Flavitalea sp.]
EECRPFFKTYRLIYRYAIFYTIIAFIVCFISTWVAIGMYFILFALFAAPKELTSRLEKTRTTRRSNQPPAEIEPEQETINV